MKLRSHFSTLNCGVVRGTDGGFTLPEILTAMTVFVLLVGGVVTAHLFGLRMFQITETKISATGGARKTIEKITDEIRTCKNSSVGNIDTNGFFLGLLDGEEQKGTAIEIQPTTNNASLIYYFVNPSDQTFRRTFKQTTNSPGVTTILAETVANKVVFYAQDYSGNILTNNRNNRVIRLSLEFYQPERFMQVADYYKLETAVTRRAE